MTKMKKLLALTLALLFVVAAFAGCTEKPAEQTEAPAAEYKGQYDVLKMGTNAAFPPYEYKLLQVLTLKLLALLQKNSALHLKSLIWNLTQSSQLLNRAKLTSVWPA